MNAKTTRTLKDARPLLWPWCVVALAGVLPLVHPPLSIRWISAVGFFIGIPLLATLSLGDEFQHRTLSLLLSQPVDRMEIWAQKMGVTILAVLSVGLIYFCLWLAPLAADTRDLAAPALWIIVVIASATFWTLLARSTLGGVVLNIAGILSIILARFLAAMFVHRNDHFWVVGGTDTTITLLFLCYAGAMLWLGRRKMARFQVTGGLAGDDLLTAGPDVMPKALGGWLRCRPTAPVLNLIRKELRLLRPVWLITLLTAVGWTCITLYRLLHPQGSKADFEFAVVGVAVISILMIAILAGSLSLGEERTSGAHAWHLTMPVSALRLWSVKLFMALCAGVLGAGLPPGLIAGIWIGKAVTFNDLRVGLGWLAVVLLLTFASFWCACAVNGTVPAVLWVLPVMMAIGCACGYGDKAGGKLAEFFISRFDPFANLKFTAEVFSLFDPSKHVVLPFIFSSYWWPMRGQSTTSSLQGFLTVWTLLLAPTLVLALIQSYRLFRAQVQDSNLLVVRKLLPLAALAFVCTLSVSGLNQFVSDARGETLGPVLQVNRAIELFLSDSANRKVTHPLQLTVDDLDRVYPLPLNSRRYLRNSRITVSLDQDRPNGYCCVGWDRETTVWFYDATIHFPNGYEVILSRKPAGPNSFGRFSMGVSLPGVPGTEPLSSPW